MSGPSSHVRPSQLNVSKICCSLSSRKRARSVSSIRRTNWPPCWRTKARSKSDTYAVPTWGSPVGLGATRSRTGPSPSERWSATGHERVREGADALDLDLHALPVAHGADSGRRTGQEEVTRQQRHHRGDVGDELGH